MARWEDESDFVRALARKTELPLVSLPREEAVHTDRRCTWAIGLAGVPASVVVRETPEGLDLSVDWVALSARAIAEIDDEPTYVAATTALGAMVGAVVGRTSPAAAVGGALGCVLGMLTKSRRS